MDAERRHRASISLGLVGTAISGVSLFLPALFPTLPRPLAWVGLGLSTGVLVWGLGPMLPLMLRRRRYIPLREATGVAYAGTRNAISTAFLEGYGTTEDRAVNHFFHEMVRLETPIYGKTPPARDWVRLGNVDFSKEALWEMKSIKPHHEPVRITDLSVKRRDLRRLIRALNAEG